MKSYTSVSLLAARHCEMSVFKTEKSFFQKQNTMFRTRHNTIITETKGEQRQQRVERTQVYVQTMK